MSKRPRGEKKITPAPSKKRPIKKLAVKELSLIEKLWSPYYGFLFILVVGVVYFFISPALEFLTLYMHSQSSQTAESPDVTTAPPPNPIRKPIQRVDIATIVPEIEKSSSFGRHTASLDIFSDSHNSELLWGTYRPNLYFGMRSRAPTDSIMMGMMWYEPGTNPYHIQLRHIAKSEDDVNFRWLHHNGRDYGHQIINDTKLGIELNITMFKKSGNFGGDWSVQVKAHSWRTKTPKLSVLFYFGIEQKQLGSITLDTATTSSQKPLSGVVELTGYTPSTSEFSIVFPHTNKKGSKTMQRTYFSGVRLPEVWQIERNLRLIVPRSSRRAQLENIVHSDSNAYVLQTFQKVPFEMDVVFLSNTKERFNSLAKLQREINTHLTGEALEETISQKSQLFESRFNEVFLLKQKGFTTEYQKFAMSTFSNLIGGIGYFYGHYRIHRHHFSENDPQHYLSPQPKGLFTATPSRTFFPRGFMWDEGFHQLLISNWDKELSKDMLAHWLKLINDDGWLPREQILGAEAESRVPPEFIVQYPDNANPPTLYLPIESILDRGDLSENDKRFLKGAFKALASNYVWFLKTQRGPTKNSFHWRGCKGNHTLPSGLDDYPRRSIFERSELEEHVDLLCWMITSSNILDKIARAIDIYDIPQFKTIEEELITHLQEKHWSPTINAYCDYDGELDQHVKHLGYVSLFPFLFGLIPIDSPKLAHLFDLMEREDILKTNFGLRSLSASDPLYGKDENYWRGPVWININYLVLRALHRYYATTPGPYTDRARSLYTGLRKNLISNVYKVYKTQNDIFENYSPINGRGQGQHPFTGWSSLIILIMGEIY
eukprot:TRINITY_DN4956_c0_g1_i1.p1 TRINITY_DN4956_c0_g1~~TRINITY_DN4956_c0_g1_i1.p1  ORF type:complete len:828 (+),score=129.84 TRINITY_DN4956_c0_g1_i1:98-2581(+)